jgi:uncharacterized protein
MSNALHSWYSLRDLAALGERAAILRGEIRLRRLPRLSGLLSTDEGSVRASLSFRQRGGWVTFELEYETTLELTCQRCLAPVRHCVSEKVNMIVMEESAMERHAPEGYEPLALDGDRIKPAELIEDELIVSLPLVPRHARTEECGGSSLEDDGARGACTEGVGGVSLASH